jgi:murein DD-endopeptidase MepM/ murein hydrolase activator NlpD
VESFKQYFYSTHRHQAGSSGKSPAKQAVKPFSKKLLTFKSPHKKLKAPPFKKSPNNQNPKHKWNWTLIFPFSLFVIAIALFVHPLFTGPNAPVDPAEKAPPLLLLKEKDLQKIESAEGTNQFVSIDSIADFTDEEGNEIDMESLTPKRIEKEDGSLSEKAHTYSIHKMKTGESIWQVARRFHVSLDSVMTLNQITDAGKIRSGDSIKIPRYSGVYYTVNKNDTVELIARKYGVSSDLIRTYNDIGDYLDVGKSLFIYGAKLTSSERQATYGVNFVAPVIGYVTSPYGMRIHPILNAPIFHTGLDIGGNAGASVKAASDGVVTFAGENGSYGNFIVIKHASGYESAYGHLSKIYIKNGKRVAKGEAIGEVGSTGLSTGPHLHFEIKSKGQFINPLRFISLSSAPVALASPSTGRKSM